ncbi:MAG TPA: (E)-4-hydroxy-3-methylbut-2-enyl-diphosphate synthase, partial [Flavobacteriales bacterium]|nr:(E)-4-hydroxy-3-methylbut-2-enyl-diphosphate synthase [Flavobacteriales bacterium]
MEHDLITYAGKKFCNNLKAWSRFKTREVMIGNIGFGAENPIRLQSMTTTDTMNTAATVEQSIRMIEAGCELVRITAPSKNEAENLQHIKNELRGRGYITPLVADIHFTPNAAEIAARIVEKVRVNPGNYADKKKFEEIDYTREAYDAELARIRAKFTPLVRICKENHTAMRIGTNHGSLSDRIMSFYGDSPLGMVESAMEFLRICCDENYHNIVLSMKASNAQVMVQAYRLLNAKMIKEGMNYPLHLGVTEAGDGEDGRIKSAVGIGTLLEDGLGDTIRVSLTEDPEFEIPVAKTLADRYATRNPGDFIIHDSPLSDTEINELYDPFNYTRRHTKDVLNIGGKNVPRVLADFSRNEKITIANLFAVGYNYSVNLDKWNLTDQACDYLYVGDNSIDFEIPGTLGIIHNSESWKKLTGHDRHYPLFCGNEFFASDKKHRQLNFVSADHKTLTSDFIEKLKITSTVVLVFDTFHAHAMADLRLMFLLLKKHGCETPVIIKRNYTALTDEQFQMHAATDAGGLFLDGFGDGLWLKPIDCSNPQLT